MHRCLVVLSIFLLVAPSLCLELGVNDRGAFFGIGEYEGYDNTEILFHQEFMHLLQNDRNPWGTYVDLLYNFYSDNPSYQGLYDHILNSESFAPWPAPHVNLFTAPSDYDFVFVRDRGFVPLKTYFDGSFTYYPGEYLGIGFDIPATEIFARFESVARQVDDSSVPQYYYHTVDNNSRNWPYDTYPYWGAYEEYFEFVMPFHVTAKTVDGYFYYDWLLTRSSQYWYFSEMFYADDDDSHIDYIITTFFLTAFDPRGIDWLKVYSLIPENNREDIYTRYFDNPIISSNQLPFNYHYLYLDYLAAAIATPSSTRTISATVTPSPQFARQPSHSATRSPSVTHTAGTITPTSSHTPIYVSGSNTPTRTPNRSTTSSPTPSQSFVAPASPAASASALGQTATSTHTATPSNTPSPVTPTTSPTVTNTATGTRTAFLTASNTQQPGRNVPSASIAPSASAAALTFTQPDSSTAVLVQFNVLCFGYCSGESATQLQLEIARALNLNEEFIRIVAIHEFFEGDSEITILICSNDGVDTLLNSIQSGSFTQDYFTSISVESVDWTVRCDMDLYNYLALSSQYIDTGSSATSLMPLFVLFFLPLWMLA